jgi:hypothetical protein
MRSVGNNHAQFRGTTMRNFGEDLCVENSMFLQGFAQKKGWLKYVGISGRTWAPSISS